MELLVASLREVCWHFRIMEKSMEYLDTTGRIFDVQRYSIHDGPGIRTIVFLKGCVLSGAAIRNLRNIRSRQ